MYLRDADSLSTKPDALKDSSSVNARATSPSRRRSASRMSLSPRNDPNGLRGKLLAKLASTLAPDDEKPPEEVVAIAATVEEAIAAKHGIGSKDYTARSRSLVFNLTKNNDLRKRVLSRAVSATWLVNASVTDLATDALKMQRKESLEHYQALRSLGDSDELAVGWNAGTTGKLGWSHKYEKETVISGAAKGNSAAAAGAAASASTDPAGASAGADVATEAGGGAAEGEAGEEGAAEEGEGEYPFDDDDDRDREDVYEADDLFEADDINEAAEVGGSSARRNGGGRGAGRGGGGHFSGTAVNVHTGSSVNVHTDVELDSDAGMDDVEVTNLIASLIASLIAC
jgi:hypothetical protein